MSTTANNNASVENSTPTETQAELDQAVAELKGSMENFQFVREQDFLEQHKDRDIEIVTTSIPNMDRDLSQYSPEDREILKGALSENGEAKLTVMTAYKSGEAPKSYVRAGNEAMGLHLTDEDPNGERTEAFLKRKDALINNPEQMQLAEGGAIVSSVRPASKPSTPSPSP